ncbi:MAG: prepilin-type N-terminal cleavage/methylation domain-containing protein [Planctomycetota bacterium]|nr:prepilin-type N-terminal cleavage/methylation domain-containing protein [Planctomycetota bacterium]
MSCRALRDGFTLLELAISLALVSVLLATLLPALASARLASYREQSSDNQRRIGQAWLAYLLEHDDRFPYVPVQPAWYYGGVRFSTVNGEPFLDTDRPLTRYVARWAGIDRVELFHCPADRGIGGETEGVGTAGRTAFRAYGTSYRANAKLLDARLAGVEGVYRGLRKAEIATVPSRLVVMGEPIWFEVRERTGRDADWYGDEDKGNLLFLDGSVRYMTILPEPRIGPAVYEPRLVQVSEAPTE